MLNFEKKNGTSGNKSFIIQLFVLNLNLELELEFFNIFFKGHFEIFNAKLSVCIYGEDFLLKDAFEQTKKIFKLSYKYIVKKIKIP